MTVLRRMPALVLVGAIGIAAGCGSSNNADTGSSTTPSGSAAGASTPPSGSAAGSSAATATGSGPVDVLYAGSLVDAMEKQVGPAFDRTTGYEFTGFGAGSTALATQIKGKVHPGDVFISASPKVNAWLEGSANGGWVSWYATFATSSLVIGYNPKSKFAAALTAKPWYQVVTQPGFKLGSTDPATDPKGKLAAAALNNAATSEQLPALAALARSTATIYPEETLVGRLQAGQLDAGFFYASEARAANIATVPLTGQKLAATYTVTVLNRAPHPAAAIAFIRYLLGPAGQSVLRRDGFTLVEPPTASGSGVPPGLSGVIPAH
ncbi:MAG: extracellular solute-binding protein [Mycobacteriales bacterium]|nr:MAG: ABC transporter substrate-binding protein [Pseudonocardiales bacterium]